MALTDTFPGPSGLTDSIEAGKDIAALLRHESDGTPRAGVTWKPSGNLVTARADLRVDVAAFKGALVRNGAARLLANDAVAQSPDFTVPTANSRIDVLYVKVGEVSAGDATDGPFFGILEGTASATPVTPTLNIDGALSLATVRIPSTATATNSAGVTITQTAPRTSGVGGTLPDPVTVVPGVLVHPAGIDGVWTDSGWAGFSITLDEAAWVELELLCWVAVTGAGNDLRTDVRVQGATTVAPQSAGWGAVAFGATGTTTNARARKKVKLNAGVNQIRLSMFRTLTNSGTYQLTQSTVTVTPIRSA